MSNKKHACAIVKGVYYRMIRNLQLSDGSQDLQYIHALLVDPQFVLMENIVHKMMGKIYQMIQLSKGDPDTSTLTEEITGPYKADFTQYMTQEIKELG